MDSINYISVDNLGWLTVNDGLFSWGHNDLPADIHFTISFDKRSNDINFHLTRNVTDQANKPKIRIASISRDLFKKLQEPIAYSMIGKLLVPMNIKFWQRKYGNKLYFLSFNDLETDKNKVVVEQRVVNGFKEISTVKRKTRLKIKISVEEKLTGIFSSSVWRKLIINNIKRVPRKFGSKTDAGLLIAKKQCLLVLRIDQNWYQINKGLKPFDLLADTITNDTKIELENKFRESPAIIKTAESYQDTQQYDKPIYLEEI